MYIDRYEMNRERREGEKDEAVEWMVKLLFRMTETADDRTNELTVGETISNKWIRKQTMKKTPFR